MSYEEKEDMLDGSDEQEELADPIDEEPLEDTDYDGEYDPDSQYS